MKKNPYEPLLLDLLRNWDAAFIRKDFKNMEMWDRIIEKTRARFVVWEMTNEISRSMKIHEGIE